MSVSPVNGVVVMASVKGGVGKTTLAITVLSELLMRNASAIGLDCDPNGHFARMAQMSQVNGLEVVPKVDETTVLQLIRDTRSKYDFVVVDLPGVGTNILTYAVSQADLVVIPMQTSAMDLTAAEQTAKFLERTAIAMSRQVIPMVGVVTKTPPGIKPRVLAHSRQEIEKLGIPLLPVELLQRSAFQEMTYNGRPPALQDGQGAAAENVRAMVDCLLAHPSLAA